VRRPAYHDFSGLFGEIYGKTPLSRNLQAVKMPKAPSKILDHGAVWLFGLS